MNVERNSLIVNRFSLFVYRSFYPLDFCRLFCFKFFCSLLFVPTKRSKRLGTDKNQSACALLKNCLLWQAISFGRTIFVAWTCLLFYGAPELVRYGVMKKYNAPHCEQSSLPPVKPKSSSCDYWWCRLVWNYLLLMEISQINKKRYRCWVFVNTCIVSYDYLFS